MKKIKLKVIFIMYFLLIGKVFSQTIYNNDKATLTYSLEFEFTGKNTESLDSVFIGYCVIDAEELKQMNKIIISTGAKKDQLVSKYITLNEKIISNKNGKVYFELGQVGDDLSIIEIKLENYQGKIIDLYKTK